MSQTEAIAQLQSRLAGFAAEVEAVVQPARPNPYQLIAMTSLAYNIGSGAFATSSVARNFRAGQIFAAADSFLLWDMAGGKILPGLESRRRDERTLFLTQPPPTLGAIVIPEIAPPVSIASICVFTHATLGPAAAAVTPTGAVYCGPENAYLGGCNGKLFFSGRTAARIEAAPQGGYIVTATSGETYGPDFNAQ